jgi:hypothetical protein
MITLTRTPHIHVARCWNCSELLLRQERKDGVCATCADGPAVSDVNPCAIVEWAMDKARREEDREDFGCYPAEQEILPVDHYLPTSAEELDLVDLLRNRFDGRNDY